MTIQNISVAQYISGRIRQGYHNGDLVDYNSVNRNGVNFVYPDRPKITDLLKNKNNFPRISIESMDTSNIRRLGQGSTQYQDLVQLAINIWCPPSLTVEVNNVASEDNTYLTGTDTYTLEELPVSTLGATIDGTMTGEAHSFVRGTDYQLSDTDYDGLYDSIEWLNVDTPDNNTTFTSAYNRKATGNELCRMIGSDIDTYIREHWMIWAQEDLVVDNFKVMTSHPVQTDAYQNVERYEIYCTFTGLNPGRAI